LKEILNIPLVILTVLHKCGHANVWLFCKENGWIVPATPFRGCSLREKCPGCPNKDSVFHNPYRPLCNLVLGEGEAAWLKERSRGGWSRRRYFNLISVARQFMARGLESNLHKLIYFSDLNN